MKIIVPFAVVISDTSSTRTKMAEIGYHRNLVFMIPWLKILLEQTSFSVTTSSTSFLRSPHVSFQGKTMHFVKKNPEKIPLLSFDRLFLNEPVNN